VQIPLNNHPNVEIKEKEKEVPKESTKKDKQVVDTQEKSFVPKDHFLSIFKPIGRKIIVREF